MNEKPELRLREYKVEFFGVCQMVSGIGTVNETQMT